MVFQIIGAVYKMKIMILLSIDLHSTNKPSPYCIESMFLASNNCYWPGNMLIEYDQPCQLNRLAFATTECHDISVEFGKLQYVCYFLRIQIDGKTKYHSSCVYCRYCTAAFSPSGACLARQKKESHWCNVCKALAVMENPFLENKHRCVHYICYQCTCMHGSVTQ